MAVAEVNAPFLYYFRYPGLATVFHESRWQRCGSLAFSRTGLSVLGGEWGRERPPLRSTIYGPGIRAYASPSATCPGSLPARAYGAIDPCGKAAYPPARRVEAAAGDVSGRRVVLDEIFLAPPCVAPGPGDNGIMPNSESDFTMKDGVLRFKGEAKSLCIRVKGPVINSVPSPKRRQELRPWKEKVARAVKAKRGGARWVSEDRYAVTVRFRFCRHENQTLDVDNYVKPVLDGLAAGLFLDKDPGEIETFAAHHGVDDSNFRILLIHRLPDAETPEEEGICLFVSSTGT